MNGTCITETLYLLKNNPDVTPPIDDVVKTGECCFEIKVLAELSKNADPIIADYRNDQHSFVEYFDKIAFESAEMFLQKLENGVWQNQGMPLADDTYGTNYSFGFYETLYNENAIGYCMDFHKILVALGEGDYRLKAVGTNIFGTDIESYSLALCLKTWTTDRADNTVRLDWYRNGNNGEPRDFTRRRDYGALNWFNQIRVEGMFWGKDSTVTRENVKYQNGNIVWTQDSLINEYALNTGRLPDYFHDFLRYDMFQSDTIKVNDYNIINPTRHKNLYIYPNSGYSPIYDGSVLLSSVELKFLDQIQQFTHNRS